MIDQALTSKLHSLHHEALLEQAGRDRLARQAQRGTQGRPDDSKRQMSVRTLLARLRLATNG